MLTDNADVSPLFCAEVPKLTYADAIHRALIEANIGRLDRCLSELKLHAMDPRTDAADLQTIKHHAEDCIGLGNRVLEILKGRQEARTP